MKTAEVKFSGGAEIGRSNSTWPIGKLWLDRGFLIISSGSNSCKFSPDQVISLSIANRFLSSGIQITHNNNKYPPKVIFWTMGNPQKIINEISSNGFIPSAVVQEHTLSSPHKQKLLLLKLEAFSFRIIPVLFIMVLWALFLLLDSINLKNEAFIGIYSVIGLAMLCITSILIIVSGPVRKIFLKEDRDISEVRRFLVFLAIISGLMCFSFFIIQFGINAT